MLLLIKVLEPKLGLAADNTELIFHLVMSCLEEQRSQGLQQWLATLTPPTVGEQSSAELQLTMGALIVEEMRAAVEKHTGFQCSAGISHNKVGISLALLYQTQHLIPLNHKISFNIQNILI